MRVRRAKAIPICDWLANQAHRYVGIAITTSGEDLSQGFYTYVPNVDEFQDWPQFTVHDNYLIMNHVGGKASTWVFDANALANGVNAGSALKVQPLLTISPSQFSPTPDGGVIPVNMNGESSGVTYLVGASGNNLVIYGIAAPVGNLSGPPAQMTAATINLGRALGWVPSGAVYQNGNIYLADCSDNPNSCQTSAVHILRIPVSASGNTVVANSSGGAGFLDTQVTSYAVDSNAPVSNYLPALQVTDNGDLVVVYASGQYSQGHPVGAYYSVLYSRANQSYQCRKSAGRGRAELRRQPVLRTGPSGLRRNRSWRGGARSLCGFQQQANHRMDFTCVRK